MANAVETLHLDAGTEELRLHQALHGYAEGHRLLESSISIPDDLKRVMLRMSDLSGASVISGFQDYLTGYPLPSLDAYALARTWYAPEMSRPGCVWTHSVIIPASTLARITSLSVIRPLFRRPDGRSFDEAYSRPIFLNSQSSIREPGRVAFQPRKIQALIAAHYRKDARPVIVPATNSDEYADIIFAVWSQKWPALRMSFTFCTGSLAARTYDHRPIEVQCVPLVAIRQVSREIEEGGFGNPVVLDVECPDLAQWTVLAGNDASRAEGGQIRTFLWSVADQDNTRADFESFVEVYNGLEESLPVASILKMTAHLFPSPTDGLRLKRAVLGNQLELSIPHLDSEAILLALATTEHIQSFDFDQLFLREQATRLLRDSAPSGRRLLGELFRASLNPIGDQILTSLILAMCPEDALKFATDEQQFLPALFRVKASLAVSAQLWRVARDRKRELFESLSAQSGMEATVVQGIIDALLDSNSETLIGRAFEQWGTVAVLQALNWFEAHGAPVSESCLEALRFHVQDVVTWVNIEGKRSTSMLTTLAHVVAPYSSQIANDDSTVWLHTLRELRGSQEEEASYISAFVLALALCNAPPAPLDLISESFERVHQLAEREELRDDAWYILQPLVPELSWRKNWDKCERMRRALISAFVRYGWPPWQLKELIKNQDIFEQLMKSARKMRTDNYFRNL